MNVVVAVIVGAGPVGSATARLLAGRGQAVRVVTRHGAGPEGPGIERVAADATDRARLAELAKGATALFNCANPQYHRWATDWPPLATALLHAAEASGAVLVTMSNLYGYGPVDGPLTEDLPLAAPGVKGRVRAQMWLDALRLHEAGRIRATEARASDFVGFRVNGVLGDAVLVHTTKGRTGHVLGDPDVPHTFTAIDDVALTLATLAGDARAWGRPWHVPSAPAISQRAAAVRAHELAGLPPPKLSRVPGAVLWAGGWFSPLLRELRETRYQFERPFVLDSSRTQATFGLVPTPIDQSLAAAARAYHAA
jgi:nucleoside-diphosphate-sugar epimerase